MKTLEVKLEGGPFKILQPKENAVTEHDGIRIEEAHLGQAEASANYRHTFKKAVANRAELSEAKRRVSELIEKLRKIFPFVGGNLQGFKEEWLFTICGGGNQEHTKYMDLNTLYDRFGYPQPQGST